MIIFFSETTLVKNKSVEKVVKILRKNLIEEGYLEPPKGEENINWKKSED